MGPQGFESRENVRPVAGAKGKDSEVRPGSTHDRLVLIDEGGPDEVEDALVRISKALDFEVIVVSPNPQLTEPPDRLIRATMPDAEGLSLGAQDSVVLLTRGDRDVEILRSLAQTPLRFVGLWSDGDRAEKNRSELVAQGVAPEFLARLHAPVAGDVRFRAPSEIALAILSEVVEGNGAPAERPASVSARARRARRRN